MTHGSQRWRFWLLAVCGLWIALWFVNSFGCTPLLNWCGTLGFDVTRHGEAPFIWRVTRVDAGSAAALGRVHVGDRIDDREIPLASRWRLPVWATPTVGERLQFVFHRGSVAKLVTIDVRKTDVKWGVWTDWVGSLAEFWSIIFAALLASRRPDLPEARLLSLFLLATFGNLLGPNPLPWVVPDYIGTILDPLVNWIPMSIFAAFCAYYGRPLSSARRALTAVTFISSAVACISGAILAAAWGLPFLESHATIVAVLDFSGGLAELAATCCGIAAVLASTGIERQRVAWAAGPVGAFYILYIVENFVASNPNADHSLVGFLSAAANTAAILLPLGLTYALLTRQLLDVGFILSRTLVYTALTSILVGIFALIDFASTKIFERLGITLLLEALAALAFGFSINAIHNRIDRLVDGILFRRRYLAGERLRRTARTLSHAESEAFIDEALVVEASDALDLASSAVFLPVGEVFNRKLAQGWDREDAASLPLDDHLVINLRAELQPIDLVSLRWPRGDVPDGVRHPILAIPLVVRHDVLGFVLYGGHSGGEALDPDEQKSLVALATAAASAYEHVRANALQVELAESRSQEVLLQERVAMLREMVEALKSTHPL